MATMAHLLSSAPPSRFHVCQFPSQTINLHSSLSFLQPKNYIPISDFKLSSSTGNGDIGNSGFGDGSGRGGSGGGGGGGGGDDDGDSDSYSSTPSGFGLLGFFLNGWRSRVLADPQFPFKVLMEELVGLSSSVIGDMASRPNFGLNELDFVFSTIVVGSILNFVLMYILAPTGTSSSAASVLPSIFASCPSSHIFQSGAYSVVDRLGTFVYKGALFAAVGLVAGLAGTALSNGLVAMRKKMDPSFEPPNKPPPPVLNAMTWAIHMGLGSNLRYQTLNGVEFTLAKRLPELGFKVSVLGLRCLNSVVGGMTFVALARLTGSQMQNKVVGVGKEDEDKLLGGGGGGVPATD